VQKGAWNTAEANARAMNAAGEMQALHQR